ncbi:hypothetical protein [Chryseobacterium foetidum]|uniref:hypothetical protein n=1 Tax=Chryseobacterium foetidum TaxID=2951057 RepID=UPI0021C968D6|nr:hypothetical protein [Chryseobacterium foetidum]
MKKYYVNKNAQSNGDHEVHQQNCTYLLSPGNQQYLGEFSTCDSAVREAKKYYRQSNGCKTCCPTCHTK